ncbi:hypothetical protein VTJ04DRAFT_2383 [Mycothermus thermophilus]|uniref:uncharacterized protein n=1 Tax=Humicola insolens TaxID=85995 RepID=UPI0037439C3D
MSPRRHRGDPPSTPAPPQGSRDPNEHGEVPPTPTRPGPYHCCGDPRNGRTGQVVHGTCTSRDETPLVLGVPLLFITPSPAGLHWRDLARHMPEFDKWQTASEQQRLWISRRSLMENPAIATWYFWRRFNLLHSAPRKLGDPLTKEAWPASVINS